MLEIKPFQFSYPNQNKINLVLDQPLHFCDKKIHLITGPSGSGKSTFLSYINNLNLNNSLNNNLANNLDLAFLFQNPFNQIVHSRTDLELSFFSENKNIKYETYLKNIEHLCSEFNLQHLKNKKTKDLSHGEAQKILLASLLAAEPKVLLLDEPTASMDQESRDFFYTLLNQAKDKMLILLVDHDLKKCLPISDTVTTISPTGQIKHQQKTDLTLNPAPPTSAKKPSEKPSNYSPISKKSSDLYKIAVKNLSYTIEENLLFKNCEFSCESGQVVFITGKNGSGKSTFFKILSGVTSPTRGSIEHSLNAKAIKKSSVANYLGYILQNSDDNFFFDTLEEEFQYSNTPPDARLFLDQLDMKKNMKKSPFLLSEGEKRRAALYIQLNLNKKVILYDEPTFGQDANNQEHIKQSIKQLQHAGVLQIIISHDDEFIQQTATHIYEITDKSLRRVAFR